MRDSFQIIRQFLCPGCGTALIAQGCTVSGTHSMPVKGDTTVCIECARVLVFDAELRVVQPEPARFALWCAEEPEWADEVQRLQRTILSRPKPTPEKRGAVH